MKAKVTFDEPIMVAQATPDIRHWGPYQFPNLSRLADGRIHIAYHIEADSARSYGLDNGHAIYNATKKCWEPVLPKDLPDEGFIMPNGDMVHGISNRSVPEEKLNLPEPVAVKDICYEPAVKFFHEEQIPQELRGWNFKRKLKGETEWQQEIMNWKNEYYLHDIMAGVLPVPSLGALFNLKDGGVMMYAYYFFLEENGDVFMRPGYVRTDDNGKSWQYVGSIPYTPDVSKDEFAPIRDGFTEPCTVQLDNGNLFTLMRTTDKKGVGPMYASVSCDIGKTWSKPWVVDELGVWPRILQLKNGITLMTYGRPGLFMRTCTKGDCSDISDRIMIVSDDSIRGNTCAYSSLLAIDDNTAMMAYSDFNYPDKEGKPCKTILTRLVHTELVGD